MKVDQASSSKRVVETSQGKALTADLDRINQAVAATPPPETINPPIAPVPAATSRPPISALAAEVVEVRLDTFTAADSGKPTFIARSKFKNTGTSPIRDIACRVSGPVVGTAVV